MKGLSLAFVLLVGAPALSGQSYPPFSSCPVLASLASAKVHDLGDPKNPDKDNIVIWAWNQGTKTIHGVQYQLFLLDIAGNRYPASQFYQMKGDVEPRSGDVAAFPVKDEAAHLGAPKWEQIDGIEVHVTRILFKDATVWTPRKGVDCKTAFLNDGYDKEMDRRAEAARKSWNREFPNNTISKSKDKKP